MKSFMNSKTNLIVYFSIYIFILCVLLPTVPLSMGSTPIKLYWFSFLIAIGILLIRLNSIKLNLAHFYFFVFIIYSSFLMLFNDPYLVSFANSLIPSKWYQMNSVNVTSFYRGTLISAFQILNFFIFFISFLFFSLYSRKLTQAMIKKILFVSLIFQFVISIFQVFILDYHRAYGTLDNPQALGLFMLIISCVVFPEKGKNIFDYLSIFIIFSTILLSGTKSAIFVLVIIWLVTYFPSLMKRRYIYILLFLNFSFSVILSYNFELIDSVLLYASNYLNTFSMYLRYILWNSFTEVISSNLLFGVRGTTVHFSENVIWFILLSYGLCGSIIFFLLIHTLLNYSMRNCKTIYLLLLVLVVQGFSYYGVMVGTTGVLFWSLLGVYFGRKPEHG